MKKRITSLMLAFAMIITVVLPSSPSFAINNIYSEDVIEERNKEEYKDEYIDIIIELKDKVTNLVRVSSYDDEEDVDTKREKIVENLKINRDISQKSIMEFLEKEEEKGKVKEIESFYIINSIRVLAKKDTIEKLKNYSNIERITLNEKLNLDSKNTDTKDIVNLSSSNGEWNLENTKVKSAWQEYGTTGKDIVIGFIDSGVDYEHPSLKENWRGYENGKLNSKGNWIDIVGDSEYPIDEYGHGTATAGVAVGKKSSQRNVGVAPNSKWIAARAFSSDYALNNNIIAAGEWMLAPGGDVKNAPDIINNSWGGSAGTKPWFDKMLHNWISAGIFPVFAAGNLDGSGTAKMGSIENPASLIDSFSVGAIDSNNVVGRFSKKGPSPFDEEGNIIKPEVVAPGVNVYTTSKSGGYDRWTGTSIATPHVCGIAALVKEANKTIGPYQMKDLLISSTEPLVDSDYPHTPNMAYGYGYINALKAVQNARISALTAERFTRISGSDRYATSEKISSQFYQDNKVDTLYIANGNKFADGLTMGPMTFYNNGPLILTDKDNLSNTAKEEIKRLNPGRVIVIGGTNSISDNILVETQNITKVKPIRIFGKNRYETSTKIAEDISRENTVEKIFLVNGMKDADAISAAAIASKDGIPIVTNSDNKLLPSTKEYIDNNKIKEVIIIGGNKTINDNVKKELENNSIKVERLSGSNRYATASKINTIYFNASGDNIFIANGVNTADALAIGPVAGKLKAPIQIIPKDTLPDEVKKYLKTVDFESIYLLGGKKSISETNYVNLLNLYK